LAGRKFVSLKDEKGVRQAYMQNAIDATGPKRAEKLIRDSGYDGVRYLARFGSRAVGGMYVDVESISYVVFEPDQIEVVGEFTEHLAGTKDDHDQQSHGGGKRRGHP